MRFFLGLNIAGAYVYVHGFFVQPPFLAYSSFYVPVAMYHILHNSSDSFIQVLCLHVLIC